MDEIRILRKYYQERIIQAPMIVLINEPELLN